MTEQSAEISRSTEVTKPVDIETLTISVTVNGMQFNRSLANDLRVSEQSINQYLMENPGKTAFWSTWHGKAKVAADEAKVEYEETLARTRERIRKEARDAHRDTLLHWGTQPKETRETLPKPSLPTNPEIDDRALLDEGVRQAYEQVLKANEVVALLGAAVQAMHSLSSTLISLSANMRIEWSSLKTNYGRSDPQTQMRSNHNVADTGNLILEQARQQMFQQGQSGSEQPVSKDNGYAPPIPKTAVPIRSVSSAADPVDIALSMMLRGDTAPQPGWHKHPKTGEWVSPEVQFDANGNEIPF